MYVPQHAWAAVVLRSIATKSLFPPWQATDWMSQDDSVRGGGTSFSFLDILTPNSADNALDETVVKFHGNLDYESLGGAGFASQRTVDEWPELDLSPYNQLLLEIPYTDGKKYTINLKDDVPPLGTNDRATVSWGFDFQLAATAPVLDEAAVAEVQHVVIPLASLVPTFNGRVVNDSAPFNTTGVKRISIMIRSFFAEQEGDFELRIKSITAKKVEAISLPRGEPVSSES